MTLEYPLTHRALVCSRMDLFPQLASVNLLSTLGPIPFADEMNLDGLDEEAAKAVIDVAFPVFLHNLIRSTGFPRRKALKSALDQMELNIRENAGNPLVQELLASGLKGEVFNAGGLPEKADARRAVSLFLARDEWDTLYRTFLLRVSKSLLASAAEIAGWEPEQSSVRLARS
jgi:hypothetical protein